ncbi:MAG: FtsW/RodA/SpoVE family cell cycle protein [Bacteroidaceae bacterium]
MISTRFSEEGFFKGDGVVWVVFTSLCLISIVEVYSACSSMTYKSGHYWMPVVEHAAYVGMGFLLTWLIHLIPSNYFKILCVMGLIVSLPMQIATLFTEKVNDASRWLEFGGKTIQPAELVKISLVGTASLFMATMRDQKGVRRNTFFFLLGITAIFVLLILPENASTAGIITLVMGFMFIVGKAPAKYMMWLTGMVVGMLILVGSFFMLVTPEQLGKMKESPLLHRVPTWVDRVRGEERPADPAQYNVHENLQATHAKIAIATCGVLGKGPGNSVERDFLPQSYSDFIYTIIIEEGGIAFGGGVMLLYLLLMWRTYKIARQCKALFPAFLVMGLSMMMVVQAMVNMAVAVGAFPITGQPLPLISRGGTSTFISCAYVGMILSVSHTAKKKKNDAATAPANDEPSKQV